MDGIKKFLEKETAGLPNWAWLLVVGAGIAAAVIIPKLLNQNSSSSSDTSSTDSGQGLGLAIDPTTGLPYAVEGLVPSGAGAGGGGSYGEPPPPPPTPTPPPTTTPTCKAGYHFEPAKAGVLMVKGSYPVQGGYCVPDSGTPVPPGPKLPHLTIRAKTPVDPANSTRTGVPLFRSIGSFGHSVAEIPYGTQLTATGAAVTGPSNRGNTVWYPVTWQGKSGFISGFDLAAAGASLVPMTAAAPTISNQGAPWPGGTSYPRVMA